MQPIPYKKNEIITSLQTTPRNTSARYVGDPTTALTRGDVNPAARTTAARQTDLFTNYQKRSRVGKGSKELDWSPH